MKERDFVQNDPRMIVWSISSRQSGGACISRSLEMYINALRPRSLAHTRRRPGDGFRKSARPLPNVRILAPVRGNELADLAQRLKLPRQCRIKGDRRMKEQFAARELNDGHPRRERPRHLHSKERHNRPSAIPTLGANGLYTLMGS